MHFREYVIFVLVAVHAPSYARYLLVDLKTGGGEISQNHVQVAQEPSFDPEIRHYALFNEACCQKEGVPEDCMGQCRGLTKGRSFSVQLPTSRCDQYQETIKACMTVHRVVPRKHFFEHPNDQDDSNEHFLEHPNEQRLRSRNPYNQG